MAHQSETDPDMRMLESLRSAMRLSNLMKMMDECEGDCPYLNGSLSSSQTTGTNSPTGTSNSLTSNTARWPLSLTNDFSAGLRQCRSEVVSNTDKEMTLKIEMPGVPGDQVNVRYGDDFVSWDAVHKYEHDNHGTKTTRTKVYHGRQSLPFRPANSSRLTMEHGVLMVHLAKPDDQVAGVVTMKLESSANEADSSSGECSNGECSTGSCSTGSCPTRESA